MLRFLWTWIVRRYSKQQSIQRALAEPQNILNVGLLAEALKSRDARTLHTAENALATLLLDLKPSDFNLLNGHQRFCLYRYIDIKCPRPDLTIAILIALRQIGDYTVMPFVIHLAESDALTRSQQHVVLVAQDSLPALRKRCAQYRATETLLRAANVPSPSSTIIHQIEETI